MLLLCLLFVLPLVGFIIVGMRYQINGGIYRRYCSHIQTSLKGKTAIITGGNSGIGRETAIDLAKRGARVIIACRNEEKAKIAVREIQTKSGNSDVHHRHLDLSDLESVRNFCTKFLDEERRLDVLINNAGVGNSFGKRTVQGYDLSFGTNHFGHFLLTLLLLDRLKMSAPSRIVNVSSRLHARVTGDVDFNHGDGNLKYPGLTNYNRSKLANIWFTRELARLLDGTGVTAFSLHPGLVRSGFFYNNYRRGLEFWHYFFYYIFVWLIGLNEVAGAQTIIYCAISAIDDLSGRYFKNCMVTEESKLAKDHELATQLWDVSCQATGEDCNNNYNKNNNI